MKIVRRTADGTIEIYFDDMKKPMMVADDKTFTWGQVGHRLLRRQRQLGRLQAPRREGREAVATLTTARFSCPSGRRTGRC